MTYFPRYNGNSASIYDALSAVGANGSYQSRQQIAAANGISNYTGTAAQNTQMLNMLKAGNLINPSGTSTSASSSNGRTTTTYVISDDGTITETTVPADGNGTATVDVTKPMGMNKWLKYGLIAGGVAVAGLLIYKLTKKKKKVEQKPMKKGKLNGCKGLGDTKTTTYHYKDGTKKVTRCGLPKSAEKFDTLTKGCRKIEISVWGTENGFDFHEQYELKRSGNNWIGENHGWEKKGGYGDAKYYKEKIAIKRLRSGKPVIKKES